MTDEADDPPAEPTKLDDHAWRRIRLGEDLAVRISPASDGSGLSLEFYEPPSGAGEVVPMRPRRPPQTE